MIRACGTPPTHLVVEALARLGVRHAFTTRHAGSFASVPGGPFAPGGPRAVLDALGLAGAAVCFARQVHGDACLVVDEGPPGLRGPGDALATTRRGRPLAVFTADCLPLVLVDPAGPALGLVHAGWRGTVAGIAGRAVEALARLGARPERLVAAIGPSIGPCCYEVDAAVVSPLTAAFPDRAADWLRPAPPSRAGRFQLDLWQANADQLVAAGLRPEAILNPRLCTGCRADLFFSYRREGPGRALATLACLD